MLLSRRESPAKEAVMSSLDGVNNDKRCHYRTDIPFVKSFPQTSRWIYTDWVS